MTPQELESALRTLSPHEKLYRQGIDPLSLTPNPFVKQANGILRSNYEFNNLASQADPLTMSQPLPAELVYIKRHSRFRDYPIHQQDAVELAYVYAGTSRMLLNDTMFTLEHGQALIVDSDTVHTTLPLSEDDILIVFKLDKSYITTGFLTRLEQQSELAAFLLAAVSKGRPHDGYLVFRGMGNRQLEVLITEFLCAWCDPPEHPRELMNCFIALIMAELCSVSKNDLVVGTSASENPALDVLRYIEREYQSCSLAACAQEFNMAPDTVSRLLKRETGLTFNQLVQQQRVIVAKTLLLASKLPVTRVARSVGYENMTHFYKVFERETGMSPAAWRDCSMR